MRLSNRISRVFQNLAFRGMKSKIVNLEAVNRKAAVKITQVLRAAGRGGASKAGNH